MIPFQSEQELLKKHKFLIGLKPVHFEVEDEEKSLLWVRFSNGEVGIVCNTMDFCQPCLNKSVRKIEVTVHPFIKEWVVVARFNENRWICIVTGIPNDVKIKI